MRAKVLILGSVALSVMLWRADVSAAECSLDISVPVANARVYLPFIEVKGIVTPPEKLVGNIQWKTTIGGTEYNTETLHNVEGNIIVAPPFPANNAAFGPNTIQASARVDCEPPSLDLRDSEGKLIPSGGSSNTETVTVEGDDGIGGSGIDKIVLTQTSGGSFLEEQNFNGEQTASQNFPKAGGSLADGGYEAAVHDKAGNVTSVNLNIEPTNFLVGGRQSTFSERAGKTRQNLRLPEFYHRA